MPYVASAQAAVATATTFTTAAANVSLANCLLVGVYSSALASGTTPTDSSGNTYTLVKSGSTTGNFLSVWLAANAVVSSSLTATWNPGSSFTAGVFVAGFSGRASSPVDASSTTGDASSRTAHSLSTILPTAAGDDLLAFWGTGGGTTVWTAINNWTLRGTTTAVSMDFSTQDNVAFGPSYADVFNTSSSRTAVDIVIALLAAVPSPYPGIVNELSR